MAEGQWAGLVECAEPSYWEGAGSLPWAWCGAWSSAPQVPVRKRLSLFLLDLLLPSSKPRRWLSAAGSPPPTQPVPAHWLSPEGSQAVAPSLPTDSTTTWELRAPLSPLWRIVLGTSFPGPSHPEPGLLAHLGQVCTCWGTAQGWGQDCSPHRVCGPFPHFAAAPV